MRFNHKQFHRIWHKTRQARLVLVGVVLVAVAVVYRQELGRFLGITPVQASTYAMQTGYFMGNGGSKEISGLGFSPEVVIIKADDASGAGAIMKTTAMPALNTAYLGSATADAATGLIELTSDGFRVTGANSNTANARFTWIAFSGSDCSSAGQFCVGSYNGNGSSPRAITTGFSPDLVIVKAATAASSSWRSLAMPDNYGQYFSATAQNTAGALFTTLDATGFTVGATNNTNAVTFYYVAFQEVSGVIDVGTYTGNATNDRNITGVGFVPDFLFTKYATGTVSAVYNVNESYGDNTSYFTDTASLVNSVKLLQSDGFQVGTSTTANGADVTYYYAAFGGANDTRNTSGSFTSVSGSYVGTGNPRAIGNLGFSPDLVIIKASTTQAGVFRTKMIAGDSTAYLDSATANFAGGITALNPTGFTVGTAAQVNSSGITYYWTAYGNAWNPDTNTGASDFTIGAYYGNGIDNRDVTRLPFQPDLVTIKRSGATGGTWRTSEHVGDLSSFFAATAEVANNIQAINADGFDVGTTANVNTAANIYWYFAFATGTEFAVGTYTGTGAARTQSAPFQPDYLWVKSATTTVRGVLSTRELSLQGSTSAPFINVAPIVNAVTGLNASGFSVGTATEVNTNATTYRYAAWKNDTTVGTSTYAMQTGYFMGNGGSKEISGLGFSPEVVIIKANDASGVGAIMKTIVMPQINTAYLSGATADDTAGLITLTADGFRVAGANSNTANARFTWIAFSGSDCSATGQMCASSYNGNGTSPRAITTGFSPDLVIVKAATAASSSWRSLSMPNNYGQYFAASAEETTGALFTTLDATGFTVGATNNTNAVVYYFVAFQEVAGSIDVGSYVGNLTAGRSIAGVGFQPDFMFVKNAGAAVGAVYNLNESYGDSSSYFTDTANVVDAIQLLESDGFRLGNNATAHQNGNTHYYAAFGGGASHSAAGTFKISSGSYVGTGGPQAIVGLNFQPDLIIIKGTTTQAGVFRTAMMGGDSTAYLDSATANFAGGVTAIQPDGFTVGTAAQVNSSGITYYWTAFGNAWDPDTNTGASDFVIGAFYGNGLDSRNITDMPVTPDMVTVKRNGATGGTWRSTAHVGDASGFFAATAEGANRVQVLNADGFQVGTNAEVNTAANIYWYFGFATSSTFAVGTYSGTGSSQNISVGFQPYHLWVKQTGAVRGVMRPNDLSGNAALPFINVGTITGAITAVGANGFTVGTTSETNTNGANNYRYVAWKKSVLHQIHYHWRADDDDKANASSLTGGVQDTALTDTREGLPYRLRLEVSNEGNVGSASSTGFRLEYGEKGATCGVVSTWTRVGDVGGAWDMYDSVNLTEGDNTTNISEGIGGVTDENTTFLTPNGGVKDTSDETGVLTIGVQNFLELEYSIQPTRYATNTTAYCFRVTAQGTPLSDYPAYPEATFAVHITATSTGTQITESNVPTSSVHSGGAFVVTDTTSGDSHSITDVTITETGTVDASIGLDNIKLFYEYDTSNPYNCASESYSGSETQFGLTDTDGFSSANGTVSFAGSVVASSTQAVCFYPVMDITSSAVSGETLKVSIASTSDIAVSSGSAVRLSTTPLTISGTTTLVAPLLTQSHYHWRLNNGTESGAGSASGGTQDTILVNLAKNTPRRIRLEVSNEGLATSSATTYRLEYAEKSGTCATTVSGWTDVYSAGGAWDMYDSVNLTEGDDTTNISEGIGGVTDENTTFLTPNGGVRDTTSETGSLTLSPSEFTEFEYSVVATTNALDGGNYCFRVTNSGTLIHAYSAYPEVSIAADVVVSASGSHRNAVRASSTNNYLGGAWIFIDQTGYHSVTSITITEGGTVDAATQLSNIRLYYDVDTSNPYNCASESYSGSETQFGATSSAFSSANGTSTFTGSVNISATTSMCVYAVLDVPAHATSGDTIALSIANPADKVIVPGGIVIPNSPIGPTSSTTIQKPILRQAHYHFRDDDGTESGATSATGGIEDVGIVGVREGIVQRLRLEVSNEGSTTSEPVVYQLQYAERVTTCSSASGWQAVGTTGGHWSVSESANLTAGNSTTNISAANGGVTDENTTFLTPNEGIIELSATTTSLTLDTTQFVELEYALEANTDATPGTTYCFRLVANGTTLSGYDSYAEATIRTTGDFYIQRGVTDIANGTGTASIVAGTDYTAPGASTSAFIRITNAAYTGAGATAGGGTQNANSVTVDIMNPSDIETAVTFMRAGTANSTRIYWEIIEYIGPSGGDNEMIVRSQGQQAYDTSETSTSTPTAQGIVNDNDVAVFITGQRNPAADFTNYNAGISTAAWDSGNDRATFTRGVTGSVAAVISYAIVEFTGVNWKVQRAEHTYATAASIETETITPVNDVSRAFLHVQKRVGVNQVDEFGHEVWLSGVGEISFLVPGSASSLSSHVSVAWVIENTQTTGNPMVVTRSNNSQVAGGAEPSAYSIAIGTTISSTNNASLFMNMVGLGDTTNHPRAIMGAGITSTTNYELWISDTGSGRSYRTEIVDWPTAELTFEQSYYRWYANNDVLDPTDPWPVGATNLGENTAITSSDIPPGTGEVLRLRMSVTVHGSNVSLGTKQFALQYGVRSTTTCGAITAWYDVGDTSSTTAAWRGYNAAPLDGSALSGNPPTGGDLNLSVSDRAGTYEETNPSAYNPYKIIIGDDVEYDWVVQTNVVTDQTFYCFRMVESDGTPLTNYTYYPTLRTSGFLVEQFNWQWFDDETSLTPSSALAASNTAPSTVAQNNAVKLRVTLKEVAGKSGTNVKYKLQWSEFSNFSSAYDVEDFNSCAPGSRFCYYDGAGVNNATITTNVLPDADSCVAGVGSGCGTHNENPYTPAYIGEVGTTSVDYTGAVIALQRTYTDPVFIVEAIGGDATGGSGNRPAVAIITATTTASFTVRLQEPGNETDTHGFEDVAYIVMERGAYVLPDGTAVDVNSTTTNHYYGNAVAGSSDGTCSFMQSFSQTPVVLTSLQSNYNTGIPDFLTASQLLITPNDFACSVEVPDDETVAPSQSETYGWIAVSPGSLTNNTITIEATTTTSSITGWTDTPWYEKAFFTSFLHTPGIVASKQTRVGADGGWVRYDNIDADSVQLAIDEKSTPERAHPGETVGYLAFGSEGFLVDDSGSSGFTFGAGTRKEFEFTIRHADARPNTTYFFRLYDVTGDVAIVPNGTSTYASLATQSATLTFSIAGLPVGTTTEGVALDVTTTATSVPFGSLALDIPKNAGHRLMVTTNATEGYQVLMYERQNLISNAATISDITGTNLSPVSWSSGCSISASSCYGYHVGDNTLSEGSTRFLLPDTFAAISTTPAEVAYSTVPVTAESTDIVYRVEVGPNQPAGRYESKIVYIVVPVF